MTKILIDKEKLQQQLEKIWIAILDVSEVLSETEQEPVDVSELKRLSDAIELRVETRAERMVIADKLRKLAYTTPPQRTWVGLTDEEIADIVIEMNGNEPTALFWRDLAKAIEAAHGIKE